MYSLIVSVCLLRVFVGPIVALVALVQVTGTFPSAYPKGSLMGSLRIVAPEKWRLI